MEPSRVEVWTPAPLSISAAEQRSAAQNGRTITSTTISAAAMPGISFMIRSVRFSSGALARGERLAIGAEPALIGGQADHQRSLAMNQPWLEGVEVKASIRPSTQTTASPGSG